MKQTYGMCAVNNMGHYDEFWDLEEHSLQDVERLSCTGVKGETGYTMAAFGRGMPVNIHRSPPKRPANPRFSPSKLQSRSSPVEIVYGKGRDENFVVGDNGTISSGGMGRGDLRYVPINTETQPEKDRALEIQMRRALGPRIPIEHVEKFINTQSPAMAKGKEAAEQFMDADEVKIPSPTPSAMSATSSLYEELLAGSDIESYVSAHVSSSREESPMNVSFVSVVSAESNTSVQTKNKKSFETEANTHQTKNMKTHETPHTSGKKVLVTPADFMFPVAEETMAKPLSTASVPATETAKVKETNVAPSRRHRNVILDQFRFKSKEPEACGENVEESHENSLPGSSSFMENKDLCSRISAPFENSHTLPDVQNEDNIPHEEPLTETQIESRVDFQPNVENSFKISSKSATPESWLGLYESDDEGNPPYVEEPETLEDENTNIVSKSPECISEELLENFDSRLIRGINSNFCPRGMEQLNPGPEDCDPQNEVCLEDNSIEEINASGLSFEDNSIEEINASGLSFEDNSIEEINASGLNFEETNPSNAISEERNRPLWPAYNVYTPRLFQETTPFNLTPPLDRPYLSRPVPAGERASAIMSSYVSRNAAFDARRFLSEAAVTRQKNEFRLKQSEFPPLC